MGIRKDAQLKHIMKFTDFMKSLLPTFSKDQVLEDVRLTRTELKETTVPAYGSAVATFKSWKIKNESIQEFEALLRRMISNFDHSLLKGMLEGLHLAEANLTLVEDRIEKIYSEDIAGGGITYAKATLLQYVEMCAFVSKFARKFLVYFLVKESEAYPDQIEEMSEAQTPAEQRWIEANFLNFANAFKIATMQRSKFEKALGDIPDVVITTDNEDTLMKTKPAAIDPFGMRFIPLWLNPIYHVRIQITEWQHNRYKAAKEDLKVVQMRILYLERLQAGKKDARIEQEIVYLQKRAKELNFKVQEIEEAAH